MTIEVAVEVAVCILHTPDDRFLLQLRDNVPNIIYPGCWGLFGGHIEAGETPEIAVVREIYEEIGYDLVDAIKFAVDREEKVIRHIFSAPLDVGLADLVLGEGWDMGLLTLAEIATGAHYSTIANQVRPIGPIHQRILQSFASSLGADR
jgi:8-oxo-dGTP diphosphatase